MALLFDKLKLIYQVYQNIDQLVDNDNTTCYRNFTGCYISFEYFVVFLALVTDMWEFVLY